MKLTNAEKLMIMMLADIHIGSGGGGEIDADVVKAAIISDNAWAIHWAHPFLEEGAKDPPHVSEVSDILQLWSLIESDIDGLNSKDQAALKKAVTGSAKFPGFDGNHESEHYSAAKFMVEKLDRFSEFAGRSLNSHMRSLDRYRRMLKVDAAQRHPATRSLTELIAILNA